jgi:hypothetical protein
MAYTQITLTLGDLRKLEQDGKLTIPAMGVNLATVIVLEKSANLATGAEIKDFWDNGWDGNYYHDDWEEPVQDEEGNWILEDAKLYDLDKLGYCFWQGSGSLVAKRANQPATIPFIDAFLKWRGTK